MVDVNRTMVVSVVNEHGDARADQESGCQTQLCSVSGWLLKRGKLSHRWHRRWFDLNNGVLLYGKAPEESSLKKKIFLEGAQVSTSNIDGKEFIFCIKSKEKGRLHYMRAETEVVYQEWMQAVYIARGMQGDNSQACVIQ